MDAAPKSCAGVASPQSTWALCGQAPWGLVPTSATVTGSPALPPTRGAVCRFFVAPSGPLVPALLVAITRTVYGVPGVRPLTERVYCWSPAVAGIVTGGGSPPPPATVFVRRTPPRAG